ncbi:MAG: hypothetical protein AAF998_11240 [Bacteroidota bacterium]
MMPDRIGKQLLLPVLLLVILLTGCGGPAPVDTGPQIAYRPVSQETALTFADSLSRAFSQQDQRFYELHCDQVRLAEVIKNALNDSMPLPEATERIAKMVFLPELLLGLRSGYAGMVILGAVERDAAQVLRIRIDLRNGRALYFDLKLEVRDDGKSQIVMITDVYFIFRGIWQTDRIIKQFVLAGGIPDGTMEPELQKTFALRDEAFRYYREQKVDEAEAAFAQLPAEFQANRMLQFDRLYCFLERRPEQFAEEFAAYEAAYPDNESLYTLRYRKHLLEENYDLAEAALDSFHVFLGQRDAYYNFYLAEIAGFRGDAAATRAALDAAVAAEPQNVFFRVYLLDYFLKIRDYAAAVPVLDQLLNEQISINYATLTEYEKFHASAPLQAYLKAHPEREEILKPR